MIRTILLFDKKIFSLKFYSHRYPTIYSAGNCTVAHNRKFWETCFFNWNFQCSGWLTTVYSMVRHHDWECIPRAYVLRSDVCRLMTSIGLRCPSYFAFHCLNEKYKNKYIDFSKNALHSFVKFYVFELIKHIFQQCYVITWMKWFIK